MKFDNLADLKILVAAAETGGFTMAARRCGLSTAAVSAAIKRLESSLGVRLFVRSTRSVQATREGRVMIDHARRALELVAEGQALVRGGAAALSGSLRLATSSALAHGPLLEWLPAFAAQHPGLEIDLRVTDAYVDLVREAVDVAVRFGPLPDSGLAARLLAPSHRIACASPAYLQRRGRPAHPRDLARHQCLTYEVRGRLLCDWDFSPIGTPGEAVTVPVRGALCCNDASVALDWALLGQGVIYQSALQVGAALQDGRLQRVLPDWLGAPAPLYAVLPSNRFVPPRVTVLVDALAALFARLAPDEVGG